MGKADKAGGELVVNCDSSCLGRIRDFVISHAAAAGFSRGEVGRLVLAADEASSNIIRHSYRFEPDHKIIVAWQEKEDRAIVEIKDDSPNPYLPSPTDFDLESKIRYRHASGYGKHLMQRAVDDVQFETIPGYYNKVSLVKYRRTWSGTGTGTRQLAQGLSHDQDRRRSLSLMSLFDVVCGLSQETDPRKWTRLFLYTVMGGLSSHPLAALAPAAETKNRPPPMKVVDQIGLSRRLSPDEIGFENGGKVLSALSRERVPCLADDLMKLDLSNGERRSLEGLKTAVLTPIFIKDQLAGVVSLGPKRNHQPFTLEDLSLVNLLANHLFLLLEIDSGFDGSHWERAGSGPIKAHDTDFGELSRAASPDPGGGVEQLVRQTIEKLGEISKDHLIPLEVVAGPGNTPSLGRLKAVVFQQILLTLLTHILYLCEEGRAIHISWKKERETGRLRIDYDGRVLQLERGKEGYNLLIDQLFSGGLRLSECGKALSACGGQLEVAEFQGAKNSNVQVSFYWGLAKQEENP